MKSPVWKEKRLVVQPICWQKAVRRSEDLRSKGKFRRANRGSPHGHSPPGARRSGRRGPTSSARWRGRRRTRALARRVGRGRTELPRHVRASLRRTSLVGPVPQTGRSQEDGHAPEGSGDTGSPQEHAGHRHVGGQAPQAARGLAHTAARVLNRTRFPQAQHVLVTLKQARGESQPLRNAERHQGTHLASHGAQEPRVLDKAEHPRPQHAGEPVCPGQNGAASLDGGLEEFATLCAT